MNMNLLGFIIQSAIDDRPLKEFFGSDYQSYYDVINMLSYDSPDGLFVELGVEKGRGCLSALLANKRNVIGIDHTKQIEIQNIESDYPSFTFLHQDSLPPSKEIKDEKIAILHIDTEHSFSMARGEFQEYEPYLIDRAVVLFDDLHAADNGVMEFFSSLPYPKIQDDRLHPNCGYGVMLYVK